jgi:hypothetical protein
MSLKRVRKAQIEQAGNEPRFQRDFGEARGQKQIDGQDLKGQGEQVHRQRGRDKRKELAEKTDQSRNGLQIAGLRKQ